MAKNDYHGLNLRGRSFKNRDLTGADFSDCDLRGVDFSGAKLSEVQFCRVRMGKSYTSGFWLLLLQIVMGMIAGFLAVLGNLFLQHSIEQITEGSAMDSVEYRNLIVVGIILLFVTVFRIALNRNRFDIFWWFCFILMTGAVAVAGAVSY